MNAQTRLELFLAKICGENVVTPAPETDVELYLANIAGESHVLPPPNSRWEYYLAAILGQNVEIPAPQARSEFYLAVLAGADYGLPVPQTRIDCWLALWAASSGGTIVTVSGTAPLVLQNAVAKPIRSLIQYGKCVTEDGDIFCNNGMLFAADDELPSGYRRITGIKFDGDFWYDTGETLNGNDDVTMTLANTATQGQNVFGSYNGTSAGTKNFSLFIYGGGSQSNSYFRYGEQLLRPRFGSNEHTITIGGNGTSGFQIDVTATPETFTTAATAYIGMLPNSSSPAYTGSIMGNILVGERLKYIPCEREADNVVGYWEAVNGLFLEPIGTGTPIKGEYDTSRLNVLMLDGSPETLTIGTQRATVANLFATGNVADEQDIISGTITRRTEVSVANGVITISALSTPVTQTVPRQTLRTVEGTNTVSVTSNVDPVDLTVEYTTAS
ncbi:MAG: hypothetical protein IJI59_06750 [Clostridia bacterium]|nr:hypothetical protein [Clostridia bacterium]